MGLTVVHGLMGSGKTLFLTILGFTAPKKVVSNYNLAFPYEKFKLQTFLEAGYSDCMLLIDEAYIYLESRDSSLKRNKLSSYILFQSRKKNIDMYLSVQLKSTIDVRYRELAERHVFCEKIKDNKGEKFKYLLIDQRKKFNKTLNLTVEKAKKYFKFYDTNEVIAPPIESGEFLGIDDQVKLSKQIASEIYLKYPIKNCTKAFVETYLFENKQPSFLKPHVYQYIKELQDSEKEWIKNGKGKK